MSKQKLLFLLAFLLVFGLVSIASTQNEFTISSSLSDDPYGKTGEWKVITVRVENTSEDSYSNLVLSAVISGRVESPLDGSESELLAEIWDSEDSTWNPVNIIYDPANRQYTVELLKNFTIPAEGSVEATFRLKFADCRSALYDVDFRITDYNDGQLYLSQTFPLAITDPFEPDNLPGQAREIVVGSSSECYSLLPHGFDAQDWFKFTVEDTDVVYVIETFGCEGCDGVDTYIYLYADPQSLPVASDDDSGEGVYSKIYYYFEEPGEYLVKVAPYDSEEQGYYGIRVTTMSAQLEVRGSVYDYEGGTDFSAYARLYDLNGNLQASKPVASGQFVFTVPAKNYRLKFVPHPDSGLVAEWYLNKRDFATADVIKVNDAYFDSEQGKFVIELEDSYLAYEDIPPVVTIISPEQDEVIESRSFEASFKVVEESISAVSVELYNSHDELVDAYLYGMDFETDTTHTVEFEVESDCNYRLVVTAEDESGNVVSEAVEFVVDTEAPLVWFEGFEDGAFYSTAIAPIAMFEDEHLSSTSVVLFRNGQEVEGWTNGSAVMEEGNYEIHAEAVDVAGNITTQAASFVIDMTAPAISFEGVEDGKWYNHEVTPVVVFDDENIDATYVAMFKDGELIDWSSGEAVYEEGAYEIFAWAADKAGNESTASVAFVIDTTPPYVSITSPEEGEIYHGTITVDATYSDEVVDVEVYVDDDLVANEVPYELDTALFADGTRTVTVIVYDRAGNSAVDSVSVTFDNMAPVITIHPEDGSYISATEIVPQVSIYDASLDDVYCFLNDEPYSIGTTITGEGAYKLEVIASDLLGRLSKAVSNFVLDATAPEISVTGVENGRIYNSAVSFSFTASDANLKAVSGKLNGEEVAADTTVTVDKDGTYTLEVLAEDMAGNQATATLTFTVDTTPPEITVEGVEDGGFYNRDVTITFEAEDELSGVDTVVAVLNDEVFESGSTVEDEGSYTLVVTAVDRAGNSSQVSLSFVIDKTAPEISVTGVENGRIYNSAVSFSFTASDANLKAVSGKLNGEEVAADTTVTVDKDGTYTLEVLAEDMAGNQATATLTFTLDTTPPEITVEGVEDGGFYNRDVTITFEAEDELSGVDTVVAVLNDEVFESGSTVEDEGSYTLVVTAVDRAGNSSQVSLSFVIDKTAPEISVTGVENGRIYNSAVSFSFTASDANLKAVSGKLNGEEVAADTTVTVDKDGTYTLEVLAEDMAGNQATATLTFTVDIPATAERIWGTDRYATAVQVSRNHFESSEYIVIATGENFPDALSAAPLARALDAPILLVRKDSVPAIVVQEIGRLNARKAVIIGGTGAVSDAVKSALEKLGLTVERIGGRNRFDTARLVSEKLAQVLGVETFRKAYVATGDNFPDALSVSAVAAAEGCPILLVKKDSIPAETRAFIVAYQVEETVIAGGTGVISDAVKNSLPNPIRLAGPNRYATSVEIVRYAFEKGIVDNGIIYISTGENYPDALACGSAASKVPAAVLLVPSRLPLRAETESFLRENNQIKEVVVIGGTGAVSNPVVERILQLVYSD